MDHFEKQRRIFNVVGILLLVSAVLLLAVIPGTLRDTHPNALPRQAAIATAVVMGIHLLLAIGLFIGARLARLKRRINNEINLVSVILLFIFGVMLLDGATSFLDHSLFISIGIFIAAFCDFAGFAVSIAALFILRRKKKPKPV
jgi:hypothetical protein